MNILLLFEKNVEILNKPLLKLKLFLFIINTADRPNVIKKDIQNNIILIFKCSTKRHVGNIYNTIKTNIYQFSIFLNLSLVMHFLIFTKYKVVKIIQIEMGINKIDQTYISAFSAKQRLKNTKYPDIIDTIKEINIESINNIFFVSSFILYTTQ